MKQAGFKESRDLLVSILRVCSRHADVKEAERTWAKLVDTGVGLTSQALCIKWKFMPGLDNL